MKRVTRFFACFGLLLMILLNSCERRPILYLHGQHGECDFPLVDLDLEVYWDYEFDFDLQYDWKQEWHYGWDDEDIRIFGALGYREPTAFNIRRYHTAFTPYAPHTRVFSDRITGSTLHTEFEWGFWDILTWSDIVPDDGGVQSIHIDENTSLDYVTAFTNQTMNAAHYNAPHYTRSFYQPEELFAAYEQAIEINENLDGFVFDSLRNVYVKKLEMVLEPVTYIYLTQVIIHHNNGRVTGTDGNANLSGMARVVTLNDGVTGNDAVTVHYNNRFKRNCEMNDGEKVDIIGGRVLTFGMTNLNPNRLPTRSPSFVQQRVLEADHSRHFIDVNMQFYNGKDSTYAFEVTDQVRQKFRGGVLTIELDMDTVPIPIGRPGSGFDAVVKDWEDGGTHEIPL